MNTNFELRFGKYKGQMFLSTPVSYQNWLLNQEWFKIPKSQPKPPSTPKNWNGYGKKGEVQYNAYFEYEMKMADIYDPLPDYYNHI